MCHNVPMPTLRERVRAELVSEIKATAIDQLESDNADLSLRAIARRMGMASSAIYRYFSSRDDLLTALILDGYGALADAVTETEAHVPRNDLAGRLRACANAIRNWARDHRAEYALLYGTPIPGFRAPQDTVVPVTRLSGVLIGILADGVNDGVFGATERPEDVRLTDDLSALVEGFAHPEIPAGLIARGLTAWMGIFGAVSFELWGHLHGVTNDYDALFEHHLTLLNQLVGLQPTPSARSGARTDAEPNDAQKPANRPSL